jgi:tight adherence protein C
MSPSLLGAVLGLVAAAGLLLAAASAPPLRRVRLDQRLAPYLPAAPANSPLLAERPSSPDGRPSVFPSARRPLAPAAGERAGRPGLRGVLRRLVASFIGGVDGRPGLATAACRLLAPAVRDAAAIVDRLAGGRTSVRRRLDALSADRSVEDFRVEQVLWGAAGVAAGALGVGALALVSGRLSVPALVALPLGGGLAGVLGRDRALSRQVSRRRDAVLAELPAVAELLALAVTAGEAPVGALDRVCRLTGGVLGHDLAAALGRTRSGLPLVRALEELRDRTGVPALARFVDGMAVALERGTPLADVLRAQAADVREARRRALLEAGGRREIAMLVPVVFGILPVTVVFALYPGLVSITRLAT